MKSRARWLSHGVLITASLVSMVPLLYLFAAALRRREDTYAVLFLPRGDGFLGIAWQRLTLDHFQSTLFEHGFLWHLLNSVFLASSASTASTVVCAAAGYVLAKQNMRGRRMIDAALWTALFVPASLTLAPSYLLLYHLHLLDSFAGIILPAIASAFGVYLFRSSMLSSVPEELLQQARLDGCSEVRCFFAIALPVLRPTVGAYLMVSYLSVWNSFVFPQVVLQDPQKTPLSVAISHFRGLYHHDYALVMAGTTIGVLPVLLLFLFFQRDFIAGFTSGALKG